ncbi:MAG: hypothetical protein ACRDQX_02680 [Pseudonocardiaceae bacterium]
MPDLAATVPAFDTADYELLWPRDLFARELAALRAGPDPTARRKRIEFLLDEAFLGDTPLQDFQTHAQFLDDPWSPGFLGLLADRVPVLHEHHQPRPYWPARHWHQHDEAEPRRIAAQHRFAALIGDLRARGYLQRTLPEPCIDDDDSTPVDPSAVIAERLGVPGLWPLHPANWDENTFFGLIEVFHDLVARPRERGFHSHGGCGWHYSAFATDTGRAVYRWTVNQLLESSGIELRLAESGEDTGRLVHIVDEVRTNLIECALDTPDPEVASRVGHAVALFRGRAATEHDKRSAAITLAGILEERRAQIRTEIGRKDEGALFSIANEFAIRHQRRSQQGDYDPVFLDWIVWWYLATIELTNRILARQDADKAS